MGHVRPIEPAPVAYKRRVRAVITAMLIAVLLAPYAFRFSRACAIVSDNMWAQGAEMRVYKYDTGDDCWEFTINLYKDGSFAYCEGLLSSYLGFGTWVRQGNVIRFDERRGENEIKHYYFEVKPDALVLDTILARRFFYLTVLDNTEFSLDYVGPVS